MGLGSDIAAIIGTAWGISSDIVGWFQYREQRSRQDRLESRTVFLDQRLLDDYTESLIYRFDVRRNIERAIRDWKPQLDAWIEAARKAGTLSPEAKAADFRLRATITWWFSCMPLRLQDPMPSYREIPPPAGQVGGGLDVRDDGYYPAQGRYPLPPLVKGGGAPDAPLIPSWAGLGLALALPQPAGAILGVGSQVLRRKKGVSEGRLSVAEWLSFREDSRELLDRHRRHWERYGGLDWQWGDGDGPGRPTEGEVSGVRNVWSLRGTWTLKNERDVIRCLSMVDFSELVRAGRVLPWEQIRAMRGRWGVE